MTAPTATLTVTDRYRLKELAWEQSQVVPPGKVMWCRGRRVLGYCKLADLPRVSLIPPGATAACLSGTDFGDVRAWIEGAA